MVDEDRDIAPTAGHALDSPSEPPVVARLVIEIRSDGSRTIARGALEDLATGERAAIEARGTTPLAVARSLTRSLATSLLGLRGVLSALGAGKKR